MMKRRDLLARRRAVVISGVILVVRMMMCMGRLHLERKEMVASTVATAVTATFVVLWRTRLYQSLE